MKFVCSIKEVQDAAPEMYCIEKKHMVTQKFIIDFMKLDCITDEQKDAMRAVIRSAREADPKKYMVEVRNKFIDTYYKKVETPKAEKKRPKFEDKF